MTEFYATPAVRWGRHKYVVFYSTTPWVRFIFRRDFIGEHARWEHKMAMKYGPWAKWPTWRDLHPWAPWRPIRMVPGMDEVFIPWWAQLGGWLLALWACWEAIRGA